MADNWKNPQQDIIREVSQQGSAVVLKLGGEIDMRCSMELRSKFMEILSEKPPILIVDMGEVDFMDSSGLATLVEALQRTRRQKSQLKLAGVKKRVRSVLEISRLESIFQVYANVNEALDS